MTARKLTYKFQFNGDVDSCIALEALFREGWELASFSVGDGYSWIHLQKYMANV